MKVKDLMTTDVVSVTPETTLKEVAAILAGRRISGLPVCAAEGRVVGVVSEGDILYKERGTSDAPSGLLARLLDGKGPGAAKAAAGTAGEAMTAPAITIAPERPAAAAARAMIDQGVNRLPVVRDGKLVGIVTRADLVRAFTRSDESIADEIREDVLRRALWIDPDTVDVRVRGGVVALAGEVEARSDADVLAKLVRRVPGVVDVESTVVFRVDDLARAGRFAR